MAYILFGHVMGETTTLRGLSPEELQRIPPQSETHFRKIQRAALEKRGAPGDAAWAAAQKQQIDAIRSGTANGSTRMVCPPCAERGVRTLLLTIGEETKCGTCGWTVPPQAPPAP